MAPCSTIRRGPGALVALFAFISACGGSGSPSGPSGPPAPPSPSLSHLALFPTEIVAAVGDTVTLRATGRDTSGADVPGVLPVFSSADAGVVQIEPDGRIVATGPGRAVVRATAGGQTAEAVVHVGAATYDPALGPPRVLSANYIDLSRIARISRFRSAVGHSYTDGSETCRSMKHYYQPKTSVDWTAVDIVAPASGTIITMAPDGSAGSQIVLRPRDLATLNVVLFHVAVDPGVAIGSWVNAGDHLGRHASSGTMSDIAVSIGPRHAGGTLISYFDAMTDAVFAEYQTRGVSSRAAAVITREARDADAVPCDGDSPFTVQGTLPNWMNLN